MNSSNVKREDNKVDYIKLLIYINQYHPTRERGENKAEDNIPKEMSFGMWESIGSLQICKCCQGDTTDMAKQIGIGATLFLMSTKALAVFFFVLFLINIPLLIFYKSGV